MNKDNFKLKDRDINLDEEFSNYIICCIYVSHVYAMNGKEEIERLNDSFETQSFEDHIKQEERNEGTIESLVNSIIQKTFYNENDQNYLTIASELFDRLANKHAFLDGNKRTAFYTTLAFLNSALGVHIELNKDKDFYISELLTTVKNKQNNESDEVRINNIKEFLHTILHDAEEVSSKTKNKSSIAWVDIEKYANDPKSESLREALKNV